MGRSALACRSIAGDSPSSPRPASFAERTCRCRARGEDCAGPRARSACRHHLKWLGIAQGRLLMTGIVLERGWLHGPTAHFVRHFAEMTLSMMLGMAVLGLPVQILAGAMGYPQGFRASLPELAEFLM